MSGQLGTGAVSAPVPKCLGSEVSWVRSVLTPRQSPLKQAGIGQSIVQAARPRTAMMPLLFGIGIDLDQCGVKQVHTKLSRLGFSVTPFEVLHYKQSVMQDAPVELSSEQDTAYIQSSAVTHFVADNLDHNRSINQSIHL